MAIHFSIGFVVEPATPGPIRAICGVALDRQGVRGELRGAESVVGLALTYQPVLAVWPREDGMTCNEYGCVSQGEICAPRGDDVMVIVSVYDTDGDEFDLSGATEIVFAVADQRGGEVRFVKRLTLGQVAISTNNFQFSVAITDNDTESLVRVKNYYEAQVTTSTGLKKTVSVGVFRSDDTIIKDL